MRAAHLPFAFLTLLALAGSARASGQHGNPTNGHKQSPPPIDDGGFSIGAPEIDPSALGSLASLLVGGGLLLQARRSRKQS